VSDAVSETGLMNQLATQPGRLLLVGTARVFAAEALLIPTGVLIAAYLSRRFGAGEYGLLTLASVLVVWVETNIATALSRPSIKLISDAKDWRPVGTAILRLYLLAGGVCGLFVWILSSPLAALMGEPTLATYFALLALDVPLFCAAQAHRNIIVGMGDYRWRAFVSAARWIARLLLIVIFVELGGSPVGAIYGTICASLVELLICRLYVRPKLFRRGAYSLRRLCGYALPLVAAALCMTLYGRLDLILLKSLGATAREAGVYAVAQNLALLPSLLSFAFAPALLQTLSRALRDGEERTARQLARQAMRAVLLLLPVAAIAAAAAPEIVTLIFGREFIAAAPLLRPLMFGAVALLMIAVTTSILTAAGKPLWTLHVAWPLLLGAAIGHAALIPLAGARGAAWVTTAVACAGALATIGLVRRLWHINPPARSLWRSLVVCAFVYAFDALLPASPGLLLLALKLACAGLFVPVAFLLLGEFSADEIGGVLSPLRRRINSVIEATGPV
jgi:O-antigen/teichoic acid export membrane protein